MISTSDALLFNTRHQFYDLAEVYENLRSEHAASSLGINSQELSRYNTSNQSAFGYDTTMKAYLLPVFPYTSWNRLSKCGVGVTTNSIIDNRPESDESNM